MLAQRIMAYRGGHQTTIEDVKLANIFKHTAYKLEILRVEVALWLLSLAQRQEVPTIRRSVPSGPPDFGVGLAAVLELEGQRSIPLS